MTLVVVKNKDVLSMYWLVRYVLMFIYERENMTADQCRLMQDSIINWKNHLDYKLETGKIDDHDEDLQTLKYLAKLLYDDELGQFDDRKKIFIDKGVDYKKFHRLPEAYKPEDYLEGAKHLDEHIRNNPELYPKPDKKKKGGGK